MQYGILLDPARLHGELPFWRGNAAEAKCFIAHPLRHARRSKRRRRSRKLLGVSGIGLFFRISNEKGSFTKSCLSDLSPEIRDVIEEIQTRRNGADCLGTRNFLWYWRNPCFLTGAGCPGTGIWHSRRHDPGNRKAPRRQLISLPALPGSIDESQLKEKLRKSGLKLIPFAEKAKHLVIRERFYMNAAHLSPMDCTMRRFNRTRQELFGSTMHHRGRFQAAYRHRDHLLFNLIRET